MSDKDKLQAILSLLTDQNVGNLVTDGQLEGDDERLGALVFAGQAFTKAYEIVNEN